MKLLQKLFMTSALASAMLLSSNVANALNIVDVPNTFWAKNEIIQSIQNNYIPPKGDKFYPNSPITRAEFANAVYNVIQRGQVSSDYQFSDITPSTQYGSNILTLSQLQIVFGYPDGEFKPDKPLKRSEASSVIANIIKSDFWNKSVLDKFQDKDDVPEWAELSYINNIVNDVYVNYPNSKVLLPNEYLTRAQAAVLMSKLSYALNQYKTSYLPQDELENVSDEDEDKVVPVFVGTDTLGEFKHSYKNTVNIYDTKKVIQAGNIVPVRALQRVDARKVSEGEQLAYVSPKDVYSIEGTKLYSEGTKFLGYVDSVEKSYWLKRQHKAYIVFNKAVLTDGTEFPVAGVLYSTYRGKVVKEKEKDTLKIERDATKQYPRDIKAYKFTDKLVPVIKYEDSTKDNLFMLITGDMIIPDSSTL